MKRFCIITNNEKDIDYEVTNRIRRYIESRGGSCSLLPALREPPACPAGIPQFTDRKRRFTDVSKLEKNTECAIVLGGDGTIIQAARELAGHDIPIFGVNLGTLGFLAEAEPQNLEPVLERLLADQIQVEERLMLKGTVVCKGREAAAGHALNDIVITRSGYSRIISVNIWIGGELLDTYLGDGVIISTPTGSTAYNLSAGGPIISPQTQAFVITPICPHSLTARSVVVGAEEQLRVEIAQSKKSQSEEAIVTFDGSEGMELHTGDMVEILRAEEAVRLARLGRASFAQVLHAKLGNRR